MLYYKPIAITTTLIILLGIGGLAQSTREMKPAIAQKPSNALADVLMEDIVATIYDQNGKPKLKLFTPKMVHYADHDTTHIDSPKLTLFRRSPTPWVVTATHGTAEKGIDTIQLSQNVLIYHSADQSSPPTTVKTNTLTLHPALQTADTADAITLIQPDLIVQATGMHADMSTGNIQLLSHSRGEYAPRL